MFQFVQQFSKWLSLPPRTQAVFAPRPIRFGSTSTSATPAYSHFGKSNASAKPYSGKTATRLQMELLEGRATPAHLAGIDIRMGLEASEVVNQSFYQVASSAPDWLAQPIHRSTDTPFLTMAPLCPKNEVATLNPGTPPATAPSHHSLDALLFSKSSPVSFPTEEFALSRDELFQTGEWGSDNGKHDLFASWTGAHANTFGTNAFAHSARTPDALLMASLAVVGVPLLSMGEKTDDHWEEVLPRRSPNRKKGKPALR